MCNLTGVDERYRLISTLDIISGYYAACVAIMLLASDSATMAQSGFRLHTKHKPELLFAMMRTLAHDDARISFEGRLAHTELVKFAGASLDETKVLKRNTTSPTMDFVVLPLIKQVVTPCGRNQLQLALASLSRGPRTSRYGMMVRMTATIRAWPG